MFGYFVFNLKVAAADILLLDCFKKTSDVEKLVV